MSAFIVSKAHTDAIVNYAIQAGIHVRWQGRSYGFWEPEEARLMGQELVNENYKSIKARYGDDSVPPQYIVDFSSSQYDSYQIFKACHCLHYQSCEHGAEYEDSFGYHILMTILRYAADDVMMNDSRWPTAKWEIRED